MCKSHFKVDKRGKTLLPLKPDPSAVALPMPEPVGESVYDSILPASLSWNPLTSIGTMPLIAHLKHGFYASKPISWHRNEERQARGLWPVHNPATQLEGWERELALKEILLLTGNPEASFHHLARGWGRGNGFHTALAQFICKRHGVVERKKRERAANPATGGAKRRRTQTAPINNGDYIGVKAWDDIVYGDADFDKALAADIMASGDTDDDDRSVSDHSFSRTFEGDYFVVSSSSGGDHAGDTDDTSSSSKVQTGTF